MSRKIQVRPGKVQSRIGFAMGIVFVLIGVVVAIPNLGPFGILWTAMAAFITYANFKNGFTEEGFASHEIIVDENGAEDRLMKLESLYNKGMITKEEYTARREAIINEI